MGWFFGKSGSADVPRVDVMNQEVAAFRDHLDAIRARGKISQPELVASLAISLGVEAALMVQAWGDPRAFDTILNLIMVEIRGSADKTLSELAGPQWRTDEEGKLSEEQFKALAQRVLDAAEPGNVTAVDSISAVAKALGSLIAVLSNRPGVSAEELLRFGQEAVASFAQDAREKIEAESASK